MSNRRTEMTSDEKNSSLQKRYENWERGSLDTYHYWTGVDPFIIVALS